MEEEFFTKIGIFSHTITPDKINSILGINCDKGYLTGELRGPGIMREKQNSWIIYSRVSKDLPLKDHINDLLDVVFPFRKKIKGISNQSDVTVEFSCVIFARERPAIFFTKEQVAAIHNMGASIDIDLYWLPRRKRKINSQKE